MSSWIDHFPLGISFYHPLIYFRTSSSCIQNLIYWIPRHSIDLNGKLMQHKLILILRLLRNDRTIPTDIVPSNVLIRTTNDQHLVFRIFNVNGIKDGIFVTRYFDVFFHDFLLLKFWRFLHRVIWHCWLVLALLLDFHYCFNLKLLLR